MIYYLLALPLLSCLAVFFSRYTTTSFMQIALAHSSPSFDIRVSFPSALVYFLVGIPVFTPHPDTHYHSNLLAFRARYLRRPAFHGSLGSGGFRLGGQLPCIIYNSIEPLHYVVLSGYTIRKCSMFILHHVVSWRDRCCLVCVSLRRLHIPIPRQHIPDPFTTS